MNATAWMDDFKSADSFSRLAAEHGPKLAVGALLIAMAIQAGVVITSQPGAPARGDSGAADAGFVRVQPLDINSILNSHLFGVATVASSAQDVQQTSMPLVLAGVIAQSSPEAGSAIIGPSAGAAKLVHVGGSISGAATLRSVYGDHVLIDRGGTIESLFLPRTMSAVTAAMISNSAPAPSATPGQRLQALASNNNTLFNGLARVQAVYTQGKLSGFRIFPVGRNSASAFNQLGLVSGDLVTAINGTLLDDPNRAAEIMDTLANAGSASLTVSRSGQPMEINLNLASVASAAEAAVAADAAAAAAGAGPGLARGSNSGSGGASQGSGGFPPGAAAGRSRTNRTSGRGG